MSPRDLMDVVAELKFERDDRRSPDNKRRGRFQAGWEDATIRGQVYTDEVLSQLTWQNLGHRLGIHYGARDVTEIREIFESLAAIYRESGHDDRKRLRIFGEIEGVEVGDTFATRKDLAASGVHIPPQAGTSYSQTEGADSIVVSGGYEDDEDFGRTIIYTGHGGNNPSTGRQIADQEFTRGNRALALNKSEGLPVRVVRGATGRSRYAPKKGYRYDGLFFVDDYWHDLGKSGHKIYRYRLIQEEPRTLEQAGPNAPVHRRATTTQRIVRNTAVGTAVKKLHLHRCQICGLALETPTGPYAEAAHIRPLGRPHNGPDTISNVLCLCPNHHIQLDCGAISIGDDLRILGGEGKLRTASGHSLNAEHLEYHSDHIYLPADQSD